MNDMQKSGAFVLIALAFFVWTGVMYGLGMGEGKTQGIDQSLESFQADTLEHDKSRQMCWYENTELRNQLHELNKLGLCVSSERDELINRMEADLAIYKEDLRRMIDISYDYQRFLMTCEADLNATR